MQEEKKPSRGKVMGLLAVSLVIQSLSSVFIKYAGTYETMSKEFIIFYVLAVGCLGVFCDHVAVFAGMAAAYHCISAERNLIYSDPGVVSHIVWRESHDSEYYRKHHYYSGDQFAWNG